MNRFDGECWICTTQGGIAAKGDASILGDIADVGTAIFAPELLPVVAPAVGAVTGGIEGGGKGALIGGLEGLVAGQLGGTGDLAPLSSDTGGSFINQIFTGAGDFLSGAGGGATGAVGDAGAAISAPAATTVTGDVVPGAAALAPGGVTTGGGLAAAAPALSAAPPPALAGTVGGGVPDLTAGAGGAVDSGGLANLASVVSGAGPSNVAVGAGEGAATNYSLGSAAGYPLSIGDTSASLSDLGAAAAANPAAPAAAAPAAAATGPTTSVGKFVADPTLASAANVLGSNAGTLLGAAGLGYQALTAPTLPKEAQAPAVTTAQLDLAKQATAGSAALEAPLTTGQLPPGAQAAIDNATKAAKARVIGNYAARGMDVGKDAAGNYTNASLAQDLNAIDQQAAGQVFQYADQLYQQGLSQAQISEGLLNAILQNTSLQNKTMNDAISNFVTAAAGGGRPTVNINTSGGSAAAA